MTLFSRSIPFVDTGLGCFLNLVVEELLSVPMFGLLCSLWPGHLVLRLISSRSVGDDPAVHCVSVFQKNDI